MKKQWDAETTDSPHKQAFERLAQDVEKDILEEMHNVMSLSSLCSTNKITLTKLVCLPTGTAHMHYKFV